VTTHRSWSPVCHSPLSCALPPHGCRSVQQGVPRRLPGGIDRGRHGPATTTRTTTATATPPPLHPRPMMIFVCRGQGPALLSGILPCSVRCLLPELGVWFVGGSGIALSRGRRGRGWDGAVWVENLRNAAALLLLRHLVEKTWRKRPVPCRRMNVCCCFGNLVGRDKNLARILDSNHSN
jgi:hypothetical protein